MKLSSKNKILIGIGVFVSAFIITNPSPTAFKDHLGKTTYSGLIREHNYFVYSTYLDSSYDTENNIQHKQRFFAIVGNFWINNDVKKKISDTSYYNKANKLYTNLINDGYDKNKLGDWNSFVSTIQNKQTATKFYYSLIGDGYTEKNLGTLKDFQNYFCKN